ncbi:hypothetical protein A8139_03840 [Marinomonas primoryensis]|uniref:Uncharacterized protein n=1 Tax=Marinomonas primoryensis TaxID=178399 RepID=A0A2Z4PNM8_9GAMM|nr:hypothetical protein [Marinomonas primoryensis]AWX99230.1 hypothetical protein A8139_03840 [Marinomonas primoryensis]
MKDIFDAIDSRIKSPVFGYFLLSMIAFNWKPIFFLIFDDGSVVDRITYFDEHTNFLTLFLYPIGSTFLYILCYPWIQYASIWISSKPTHLKITQNLKAEHNKILEQKRLEDSRNELNKSLEQGIIDQAKRDQKLTEEFKDDESREKVQSEINSMRAKTALKAKVSDFSLNDGHMKILLIMSEKNGISSAKELVNSSGFKYIKSQHLINQLLENDYLSIYNTNYGGGDFQYKLTDKAMKEIVESGLAD